MEKQQVHQTQGNKMKDNFDKKENKNINPKMNKDNKAEEKKAEDKITNDPIIKVEKNAKEKKHTTPKKNYAVINAKDLPISTKHSIALCNFIRNKDIEESIKKLDMVKNKRLPLPMRGEIPHKKGKGIMSARYPLNATEQFIKLLKSLMLNAIANELELEKYRIECYANVASRPYKRHGSGRFKRTHVTIKLTPMVKVNKTQWTRKKRKI